MKPSLESLEGRLVPATLTWNLNSQSKDGVLQIDLPKDSGNVLAVTGSGLYTRVFNMKNDSVIDQTRFNGTDPQKYPYNGSFNVQDPNVDSYFIDGKKVDTIPFSINKWKVGIIINGSDKNDCINIKTFDGSGSIVYGRGGHDTIIGSDSAQFSDRIFGGDGNDFIWGGVGNDFLSGDNGNDKLNGGKGSDALYGGLGNDSLYDKDSAFWSAGGGIDTVVIGELYSQKTYSYNDNYIPNDKNPSERIGYIDVYSSKNKESFTYEGKFFNGNQNEMIKVTRRFPGGRNGAIISQTYFVGKGSVPNNF